jgi:hypothetical protein
MTSKRTLIRGGQVYDRHAGAFSTHRRTDRCRHRLRAPVVATYGTNDTPELQRQARDFASAVKAAGKSAELIEAAEKHASSGRSRFSATLSGPTLKPSSPARRQRANMGLPAFRKYCEVQIREADIAAIAYNHKVRFMSTRPNSCASGAFARLAAGGSDRCTRSPDRGALTADRRSPSRRWSFAISPE